MAWIRRNSFLLVRLTVSLSLLSCILPTPEAVAPKSGDVASPAAPAGDFWIVIRKSLYTLTLYKGDQPIKSYRVVFGKGYRDGDKQIEGDKRTPEGDFYICTMNPSKRYYRFMGLSYPSERHARYGLQAGMISQAEYLTITRAIEERQQPPWDTRLGGAVGIHGRMTDGKAASPSFVAVNWTDGCIALDNADVDEIYRVVSLGTSVTILP